MQHISIRKTLILSLFIIVSAGTLFPSSASAQRWLQTSQLNVEMNSSESAKALLDTLIQVAERNDSVKVRRSSDASEKVVIADLRNKLINESGIGLGSANQVFIDYKFYINSRGFEESIESFQFLYRGRQGQEDIKMLYVDANQPWVKNVLKNKGVPPNENLAGKKIFSDQLAFARMHEDGQIVQISGNTVRQGFERKKRELVQKITRLTYESM
jgi:hypothetical protein